jgi:magnesium-transporting ATPase (P-type)
MIFAKEGLRTLCMAKKNISSEEVDSILIEFKKINMSNSKDKNEELFKLYTKIEKDFNFVGASAIEDKLQDVNLIYKLILFFRVFRMQLKFYFKRI